MSDTDRVHVFSNGTEYDIWQGRNCDKCVKAIDNVHPGAPLCLIELAIDISSVTDGLIPRGIAIRMGWVKGVQNYAPICPEREVMG